MQILRVLLNDEVQDPSLSYLRGALSVLRNAYWRYLSVHIGGLSQRQAPKPKIHLFIT